MLVGIGLCGSAIAGQAVVLDTTGNADFSRGEILEANTHVFLPPDSSLRLVSSNGERIDVQGPFQGTVEIPYTDTGDGEALISTLSKLALTTTVTTKDIRTSRSFGEGAPNPWAYQLTQGQHYCFQDKNALSLWRTEKGNAVPVVFAHRTGTIDLTWQSGHAVLPWPLDLPRKDGEIYDLTVAQEQETGLRLIEIPTTLPTRMHQAAWMTERGCPEQAMLLALTADVDRLFEGLGKSGKF